MGFSAGSDAIAANVTCTHDSNLRDRLGIIERRDWWLWGCALFVTLLLSGTILTFGFPELHAYRTVLNFSPLNDTLLSLVGMVLIFDIYSFYQHFQIQGVRRQIVESEQLFRLITENAADMIAVVDAEGRRLYNSPSYEKILGYTPQELAGTPISAQIHPDDRDKVSMAASEALSTGSGRSLEYRMRHKDGSWRTLESRAGTILKRGRAEKMVIVNRDITDRKRLEEQFRQSQKMEAIGRLSGGVAHDFNNLLGVIIGYGELVEEATAADSPLRTCVEEMLKAGHRGASLTRQLLAFSRQQVLDPRVLDLNAVVKDMEKMLKRLIGEDIQLKTILDPALGRVRADQGQLEQVIMNLAVNARDAMSGGGALCLETQNFHMDRDFVSRYPYPVLTGDYVLLTVSDSGIGMDSATRARVFEPFFTTKEKGKGTGLGLSLVYGVVKQSGGYIDVLSEPGSGTIFQIYLPKAELPANVREKPVVPSACCKATGTVLLAEDEAPLRKLTLHLLELRGYHVLEAESGSEALKLARAHGSKIDVLLTDIVMPGMSGQVLAKEIVLIYPDSRVVYMSGYTGQTVGQHGVLDNGVLFLPKPFTKEALYQKLREALESPVGARPSS
jgi:two-component system, cell cycle sensor histidine kinase and response regulator CckA